MATKKGFTLIEVLVSMMLIVIIAVGGLEFFKFSSVIVKKAELRLIAENFARDTTEKLYEIPWDDINPALTYDASLPTGGDIGTLRDNYGGSRSYKITANNTDYQALTVTVSWNP